MDLPTALAIYAYLEERCWEHRSEAERLAQVASRGVIHDAAKKAIETLLTEAPNEV